MRLDGIEMGLILHTTNQQEKSDQLARLMHLTQVFQVCQLQQVGKASQNQTLGMVHCTTHFHLRLDLNTITIQSIWHIAILTHIQILMSL